MNAREWSKRINEFIGELETDEGITDDEFLELISELGDKAADSFNAKNEGEDTDDDKEEL